MGPWAKWKCMTSCSKRIQNFKICDSRAGNHAWSPSEPGAMSDWPWLMPRKSLLAPKPAAAEALGQGYALYSRTFFYHRTPQTLVCFSFICTPRCLGSLNPGPCGQSQWANEKWAKVSRRKMPPSDWNVEKGTLEKQTQVYELLQRAKKEWPFPLQTLHVCKEGGLPSILEGMYQDE